MNKTVENIDIRGEAELDDVGMKLGAEGEGGKESARLEDEREGVVIGG